MKPAILVLVLVLAPFAVAQTTAQLNVESVFSQPERLSVGGSADIYFVVRNKGPGDFSGKFIAELLVFGNQIKKQSITASIKEDEEAKFSFKGFVPDKEAKTFIVAVKISHASVSGLVTSEAEKTTSVAAGEEALVTDVKETPKQPAPKLDFLLLLAIGIVIIIIIGVIMVAMSRRETKEVEVVKEVRVMAQPPKENELEKLYKEKAEIEEMIKIAKVKFYKRKLDEHAYKEIVKDNQGKLIHIEAKIGEIEKRLAKLEKKSK